MAEKNPPIQILMEEFAEKYKDNLLFVEEFNSYYWFDNLFHYYKPLKEIEIKAKIANFLEINLSGNITDSTFNNADTWLRLKVNKIIPEIESNLTIFNDGSVLNIETLEVRKYKKTDNIFYFINCRFPSKKDKCPNFFKFLNNIMVDEEDKTDKQLIVLMQEMFGYYLLSTQEPPITFFLTGGGSNGKSTLQGVLEQLVGGPHFVMSNSIENLTTKDFHIQELRFKRLNVCNEEQSKYMQAAKFKAMVEGARVHGEIKFGEQFSFCPRTKHIFATNNMPAFDSLDYGTRRRIKIVPFMKTILPKDTNKAYKNKIWEKTAFAPELPGIVAWAIEGAKRLIANNYTFSTAASVEAEMLEYEAVVSSTVNFIRDNFEKAIKDQVGAEFFSSTRLYKIYHQWCKTATNRKPVNSNIFRRELRQELKLKQMIMGWDRCENSNKRGFWLKQTPESVLNDGDYAAYVSSKEDNEEIPL